ncbi:DUF1697 domain-containing protein [Arthrobacter castelli]|uniref:DUF1697 domain-containing protein n=1 Tax=Arthrobacter castelli TaxID=271431 RepID=UPI0004009802|nr:DUF1697 domain-containing protein [Arthrobacter castelli]
MSTYAVFLRGINVGGAKIKMVDLREAVETLPLENVSTVLATGNIVCDSDADMAEVKTLVEGCLRMHFGYEAWVVVLTLERVNEFIAASPYPADSKEFHSYVTLSSDPAVLDELYRLAGGEQNQNQTRLGPEAIAWQVRVGETLDSPINKLSNKPKFKKATTTRNLRTLHKVADAGSA